MELLSSLSMGDRFLCGVIVLEFCAAIAYVTFGSWREALVWVCPAISNVAYLSLVRS